MNGNTEKRNYPGMFATFMCICPGDNVTTSPVKSADNQSQDDPNGQYFKCASPDYYGC